MSKIYIQEKLKGNPGQVVSFITDPEDSSKKKAIVKDAPINTLRSIPIIAARDIPEIETDVFLVTIDIAAPPRPNTNIVAATTTFLVFPKST